MYQLKLPDLGEGVHEGEILKWHVAEGDTVKAEAPLVDVETDKAAVTIPSPASGRVAIIAAKVGDVVTVGTVIAVIDDGVGDQTAPATGSAKPDASPGASPRASAPVAPRAGAPGPSGQDATLARPLAPPGPVPAAPATRRLAREMGVRIEEVSPSGPAGRVTPEDVKRHAGTSGATHAEASPATGFAAHPATAIPFLDLDPLPDFSQWGKVEVEPLRSIRRKVAHKMVTSKILIPHVTHMDEADVTRLEDFRQKFRKEHDKAGDAHLTLLAFVVKAVTAGLRAAPSFNASIDPFKEEIIFKKYFNIGIAVDTGKGLVVPIVRDADRKSILDLAHDIHDIAVRGREGRLDVSDLRGGTFTITNVGPMGGTALIAAINYPEVAILGMGKVQEKPVVRDGRIVIAKVLPLSLSFDHRIADGGDAARFVSELVRHLSDPDLLLLDT